MSQVFGSTMRLRLGVFLMAWAIVIPLEGCGGGTTAEVDSGKKADSVAPTTKKAEDISKVRNRRSASDQK